jgi:hypothetical protein
VVTSAILMGSKKGRQPIGVVGVSPFRARYSNKPIGGSIRADGGNARAVGNM